jgi:hypothetical protein
MHGETAKYTLITLLPLIFLCLCSCNFQLRYFTNNVRIENYEWDVCYRDAAMPQSYDQQPYRDNIAMSKIKCDDIKHIDLGFIMRRS